MTQASTSPQAGHTAGRAARLLALAAAAALLLAGFLLLSLSAVPYETVGARLGAAAPDGRAAEFTPELHAGIVLRLRVLGALFVAAGLAAVRWRRAVERYAGSAVVPLPGFVGGAVKTGCSALRREDAWHLAALAALLLAGAGLRLRFLMQPIRYDEAFTFLAYASKPLFVSLSRYTVPNNHLLHTLLVHLSYKAFGNHLWAIRLPVLCAGILLPAAAYGAVRALYNKQAALLAAAITAASSALIEYSTNARGHMILCLLSLVLVVLSRYLADRESAPAALLWGMVAALGFYTVPIMAYPVGMAVVWMAPSAIAGAKSGRNPAGLGQLGLALASGAAATLALYTPVLAVSGPRPLFQNEYVRSRSFGYFLSMFPPSLLETWRQWTRDVPFPILLLLLAGLLIALIRHRKVAGHAFPIVAAAAACILPLVAIQRVAPYIRVWLFLLPLFAGTAAAGLWHLAQPAAARLGKQGPRIWAVVCLGAGLWMGVTVLRTQSVYYSNDTGTLRDAREIVAFLRDYLVPGDVAVAAVPSSAPLLYYFHLNGVPIRITTVPWDDRVGWYEVAGDARGAAGESRPSRVVVVVSEVDQTIGQLAGMARLAAPGYSAPRMLRRFPFATLYELRARSGADGPR